VTNGACEPKERKTIKTRAENMGKAIVLNEKLTRFIFTSRGISGENQRRRHGFRFGSLRCHIPIAQTWA
jgi:hypothetical protein